MPAEFDLFKKLLVLLRVCVFVCVFECVMVHMCLAMEHVRGTYAQVWDLVEARGNSRVCSSDLSTLIFETESLTRS